MSETQAEGTNPFAELEAEPQVEQADQDVTPAADGHEDTEAPEVEQAGDAGTIDNE